MCVEQDGFAMDLIKMTSNGVKSYQNGDVEMRGKRGEHFGCPGISTDLHLIRRKDWSWYDYDGQI